MKTVKLRSCSANVNINERGFTSSFELVSHSTPVVLYGFVDNYELPSGELFTGWAIILGDDYDCSNTTMSHVRKFIEDYVAPDAPVTIGELRKALASDYIACTHHGYPVAVVRGEW